MARLATRALQVKPAEIPAKPCSNLKVKQVPKARHNLKVKPVAEARNLVATSKVERLRQSRKAKAHSKVVDKVEHLPLSQMVRAASKVVISKVELLLQSRMEIAHSKVGKVEHLQNFLAEMQVKVHKPVACNKQEMIKLARPAEQKLQFIAWKV